MVSLSFVSCKSVTSNCPPTLVPSEQALHEVESVIDTKPALYDYVDAIGIREEFIANGCQ
jgi:hypothetical protein